MNNFFVVYSSFISDINSLKVFLKQSILKKHINIIFFNFNDEFSANFNSIER